MEIIDIDEWMNDTGISRTKAVLTITLNELEQSGVFDWTRPELDWSASAYDAEQYERVCTYFIERFRYREISMLPVKIWFNFLHRKLAYELMPKYKPMYSALATGVNPFASEDEYFKERNIRSDFPETLLSGNSDYATDGTDREYERIKLGNVSEMTELYKNYHAVDEMMLDELEDLFVGMYTVNVNGL